MRGNSRFEVFETDDEEELTARVIQNDPVRLGHQRMCRHELVVTVAIRVEIKRGIARQDT